jgi:hypothetical protein
LSKAGSFLRKPVVAATMATYTGKAFSRHPIHKIDLHLAPVTKKKSILDSFTFSFPSPFYQMTAKGKVADINIYFIMATDSNTIESSIVVARPPMLPTARQGYLPDQDCDRSGDTINP